MNPGRGVSGLAGGEGVLTRIRGGGVGGLGGGGGGGLEMNLTIGLAGLLANAFTFFSLATGLAAVTAASTTTGCSSGSGFEGKGTINLINGAQHNITQKLKINQIFHI